MKIRTKLFVLAIIAGVFIFSIYGIHRYCHKHPYFYKRPNLLYTKGAPDSNGLIKFDEENNGTYILNNSTAKYYLFKANPKKSTGKAVIIAPGGGYIELMYKSAFNVADYLSKQGITSIVLLYRMPNKKYLEIPLEDIQNMIKLTRENAKNWGIAQNKIGVMGYSAGGHLAVMASVDFDLKTKPDFAILYYPVISMNKVYSHEGSKLFLLGEADKQKDLAKFYSPELNVKTNTPPTYIVHCNDDVITSVENSKDYAKALSTKKVPHKLTIYPKCGHGWDWTEEKNFSAKFIEQDQKALLDWINNLD